MPSYRRKWPAVLSNKPGPEKNHAYDSGYLDEGHPELHFAVSADIDQVEAGNGDEADKSCDPLGQVREPVMDIDADSCQFSHADDDLRKPIVPAQHKTRKRAPILVGIVTEGTGYGLFYSHFA